MKIAQVRAQYPQYQDLSDKQLADALHAKFYSDIPIQDYYSRIGLTSPKERTWGEAAKDIAAGVVSGAGSLVQLPGQLYGLATGDFSETGSLGLGKDIEKYGEEMKSAGLKAREEDRKKKIQEAEQKGQWEAFKTAFGETIKDPALLTSFLAEQAPQLLVPFGAAKVAQIGTAAKAAAAAEGLVGKAAQDAVKEVTKAAAERGTKAAIGAGAVQQGADVGSQAYEDIYKELIRKGATEPDAAQGAINLARAAGASGAIISLLAQRLPGARTLEESFAGVKGTSGRLVGALKGAAGEGASEIAEETGGKFGANLAMREVKPEQSLLEGLGQTAGMAAVGGVGLGGVSGALRTPGERIEVINGKKFINGKPVEEEAPAPPQPAAEMPLVTPEQVRERVEEVTGVNRAAPPSAEESVLGRLYKLNDAEAEAAREELTQQRLLRQQEQIDAEAERIAELNRRQGMPSPDRPKLEIEERPSIAEQAPELASREELLAKQAEVDQRRLEAGLPKYFELPDMPYVRIPGIWPTTPVAEEPKPVPKIVDNRPLTERAANNRLLVMRNMLQNQGGDPESLTIVPHPTVEGKFAIQSLDVPTKLTPDLPRTAITRPETPTIIDPVNAYVEIQRRTNTPAARRFVQDFEAGRITREDVERAIEQEQKAGQPQPLTYTSTGEPGIVSAPLSKPRGEREVPKLGEAPPKVETPPEEPPGEEPPTPKATLPQTLQEFEARMPIVFDKAEVREANNEGNFAKLTKALQLSKNPAIRRIGQLGAGIASKVTLKKPGRLGAGVAGVYRYADDSIQMIPSYAGDEHVNAHETLHALISKAQRYPTDRQKPIVADIEKLFSHVKKELKRKGVTAYGLTNVREFTAEAMTNPQFQFELMQLPYPGKKSSWTQFVKLVADLLGIQNTNALTEVMNLVDRLAQTKQPRKTVTDKGLVDESTVERPPTLDTTGLKVIKGRDPQLQAAAQRLKEGKITREQYEQYVNYYTPIEAVEADKLRPPSTEEAMRGAVASNKANLVNQPIADGTKVGLRLDIPSTRAGVPTVSVHEGASGKASQGKAKSYTSTAHITNATFETRSQKAGLEIAVGAGKEPLQTVEGTWVNDDPQAVFAKVKELLKSPDWVQVGFDPTRHGYFYDRKTGDPVASASEVYQIGTLLVAKDVKYAPKENFLYSVEPTIKSDRLPSYKRGVENLRKRWDKGEITAEEFANRVDMLARQIESAEYQKEFGNQFKGRERGADFIRQRLLEAKRRGELSDEAVDFAEWFILRNPALVDDLGISIRTPKEEGVGGMYSEMARVMYLMKERGNDQTIVHEILHHLERMMPKDVQTAIRKNWIKSLMEAQKNAKSDAEKTFFANLTDYHFANGPRAKLDAAIDAIKNGDVEPSFYQYTSPSEFWAVNGSEIMQGRFDAKGALLQRLKRWLSELKEKARDLFGLNSTAPIIRALDSLSKGDGKFVSKTLLDDVKETRQVIEREGAGKEAGEAKSLRDRATANFRRWFGESKVVDDKGEPLVVYHGSDEKFDVFNTEEGAFFFGGENAASFAKTYGDNVTAAYLSIKNPFRGTYKTLATADFDGLAKRGYDGAVFTDEESGLQQWVAFKPTQIKSATGNNGDYSLTNADIRKSIGGRNPGEQAISIVNSLGMGVKPPEPGRFEKAKKILKDAGDNPSLTKESAKKTLTKWLDWFETTVFSSDSAFNNKIRRGIISDFKQNPEVLGMLLEASQSQTVHADALASQFMIDGGLQYNDDLKKWESVKKDDNFVALAKKIEDLAKKYNVTKDEMERIAHTYFVAKRLPGIIKRNEELDAEIKAERATAKPDRKKIEEWESLKVFVSDEQLAMMEPGLSLVKTIPELKEVVDIWQGIRKNNIEVMVNSGLWSPEYATAMWDNMDYVPYYREEQLEEGAGPQEFIRGLQVKSKEFQLKGSGAAVNDVFDNMIRWSQYAMNRAIRAHKATQMIDAALKIEVDGKPMATKVTEEKRGMNIVRAFRDGKQELYDMADPLFVPAFSSIQNVSIPTLTFMSKVSNVLRQSVVLYPLFSVAQVPQDSFAAMFSSGLKTQHALKIPYLAVKEFVKTLSKTSQTHNELKRFGVVGVRDFSATVIRDDAEIYAGLKPPKGGWGKTKEFLEHIAMSADNAVRQAVYEASMQQGLNKSEALEKAFEIINFRRRGTSKMLNVMGQTVPFFYAYLSAQRVAYRVLSGVGISPSERKEALTTLATTSAAVAALSMLYAMAVGDDEDYAETPAAIRDRTLTIPGSGGVRIPLRPDFFLFPKIVAEHTYLMLSDKGYEDGAKFRKSMADALLSAVASPTPFPTAIKPAIEVAINYDFFQGKPLIGNFEKQKDVERQFRDSTSELAKLLGETGVISPIAADHMIRGMFGSFGGLFLFGTNQFLHSDPDVPRPEMSANEMLAALPGTSGLLKRPQESALKNDFYVLRDEVEKAANTFNDIKTRSPEGIQAFLEDEKNAIRLGMAKGVDKINRHLSDIRRRMTIITNMPESQMPADEKAQNIRELRELEREILRSVNVKELREMAKI